jgi:tetratricopeptide (TPR) repeat protein
LILHTLVNGDPGNQRWQCDLATNQFRIGRLLLRRGSQSAAFSQAEECVHRMQPLVSSDPSNREWKRSLADCRNALGAMFVHKGDLAAAKRESESARKIGEALVGKGDRLALEVVSTSDLILGRVWAQAGELERARESWERAVRSLTPMVKQARDRRLHDPLARGLIHLGRSTEAKPLVLELLQRGYRNQELLETCRTAGLSSLFAEHQPVH